MSIILKSAREKGEFTNLVRALCQLCFVPGVKEDQKRAVMDHLRWLDDQPGRINVRFEVGTNDELQLTQMTLKMQLVSTDVPANTH